MNNYRHNLTQADRHFSRSVSADIKRSTFERNSSLKTTFNASKLVPVYCDEVLPGDTFEMNMAFISRLVTPIFPTMDRLDLDFYAFFTPNRLCWTGWEELCGENKTGAWVPATPAALVPTCNSNSNKQVKQRSLADYFALPLGCEAKDVNALPLRAYYIIWNEWFRDQNLQAPIPVHIGNQNKVLEDATANDNVFESNSAIMYVNKKHDYFTSCLPSPQKGSSQLIPISLNRLIPITTGEINSSTDPSSIGSNLNRRRPMSFAQTSIDGSYVPLETSKILFTGDTIVSDWGHGNLRGENKNSPDVGMPLYPDNLYANPKGIKISGSTISELRTAFQIQKLFEKDARGGTRYREILLSHFGVSVEDYRVQVPEFLGHYHERVGMSQVAQTSATTDTSPQGNLSAFSYTQGAGNLFKKSFVEHGYVHIFCCARSPKTYQNGLPKMFSRKERFDFYYPTLAHISEQPVYTKEISYSPTMNKDKVFGYQEAWAEYRYKQNQVTGQFRSGIVNSLDNWHYADYYNQEVALSSEWIQDNSLVNLSRTLAVDMTESDQIYLDIAFMNKATRPMPVYSIPGLVDHF